MQTLMQTQVIESHSPFSINLSGTTEVLHRFHRTLMDRHHTIVWDTFELEIYDAALVEQARQQWAGRAVAEYLSTAQFAQLLHRLTLVGAPIEIIGAATRLVMDECRHADYCAQAADLLGGRDGYQASEGMSLFKDEKEMWMAIYRTILNVCCFGETLSIPMLKSIQMVATDPVLKSVAGIIANDEEYHARFGWETLTWLTPKMSDAQIENIQNDLPSIMAHFEKNCSAGPEMLAKLAGMDLEIVENKDIPNLGTLTQEQYAAIFYHTLEQDILPGLTSLGFNAKAAWEKRPILKNTNEAR